MSKKKMKKQRQRECGVLSIPGALLKAAGISPEGNVEIETVPGVILIGEAEPLRTAQWPLLELLCALGIEPEEVYAALEEGGYFDE